MSNPTYFVQPVGEAANEFVANTLDQQGESADTCAIAHIRVNGGIVVKGVYRLPNASFISYLMRSVTHRGNLRFFWQEGGGKIVPYPPRKRSHQPRKSTVTLKVARDIVDSKKPKES